MSISISNSKPAQALTNQIEVKASLLDLQMPHILASPSVSIIIPTFNCSQSISLTMQSIIEQNYPSFEIVVIDAGSNDRTLEILQSYETAQIHLSFAQSYSAYKMINQGISLAQGEYINILFPGDFYIHRHTLQDIMQLAVKNQKPELVYCGTLLRDGKEDAKFLFRQLTLDLLCNGQQPTSLQGCWFKKETFKLIGLFRTDVHLRGGFDLFCRFLLNKNCRFVTLHHALTDYDLRWVTIGMVIRHFWETLQIVYHYFGFWVMLKWLKSQKDFKRVVKLSWRRLRVAFLGR